MASKLVLTDVGLEALINAQKNGTNALVLSSVQFGTGQYEASESQTALVNPFKTLTTISGSDVGANTIHIGVTDNDSEEYEVYEVGVFTSDNILFAVYSQTTPIISKAKSSVGMLAIDIVVQSAASGDIVVEGDEGFYNPPATTETAGVVKLATAEEVEEGTDTSKVITSSVLMEALQTIFKSSEDMQTAIAIASIAADGTYFKRPSLFTTDHTTLTIPAKTALNIGGNGYILKENAVIELDTVGTVEERSGKDVYIYACQPEDTTSTEPDFVLSFNSTVPDGYTEENSRKFGGFHCIPCDVVGVEEDHGYYGYKEGDIMHTTAWDLWHRARGDNEGRYFSTKTNRWIFIYKPSWNGNKFVSEMGAEMADALSTEPFHGDKFVEWGAKQGLSLLSRDQWISTMKGSNEGTSIEGLSDPVVVTAPVDTNGRTMISDEGAIGGVGIEWEWNSDCYSAFNATASSTTYQYGGASTSDGNYGLMGFAWDSTLQTTPRLTNPDIDGEDAYYGDSYGVVVRFRSGGGWTTADHAGSRAGFLGRLSASRATDLGARFADEPRVVTV